MIQIMIIIQIILAVTMIGLILMQKTSSDGLSGLSGSGSGANGIMTGRASANFLVKTTTILGGLFMVNSMAMAAITAKKSTTSESIIESIKNDDTLNKAVDIPEIEQEPTVPVAE